MSGDQLLHSVDVLLKELDWSPSRGERAILYGRALYSRVAYPRMAYPQTEVTR